MLNQLLRLLILLASVLLAQAIAASDNVYEVYFDVELVPKKGHAKVKVGIADASLLSQLNFRLDPEQHSHVKANGDLTLENGRALWLPPKKDAWLQLRAKISHERSPDRFDAIMTLDWAIFRGDDLVPAVKVRSKSGAVSRSYLRFKLPRGWSSVNTGWKRLHSKCGKKNVSCFIIDNPERRFDRPTGWMIAGALGTRRDLLGNTHISVSAPQGVSFHRMDVLTFLGFVWPEMEKALGPGPEKILIVGGGDPMWLGGLSASNSFFLHRDRPLVSENGTSTILHELTHVFTRIRGVDKDDWIAEGLAEFYATELLFRAGGISEARKKIVLSKLSKWSDQVKSVRIGRSSGEVTARAALLFFQLDEEIRKLSGGEHNLDQLTRKLMQKRAVSYKDLTKLCYELVGQVCEALKGV